MIVKLIEIIFIFYAICPTRTILTRKYGYRQNIIKNIVKLSTIYDQNK